jgi:hypothetical protein
MNDVHTRIIVCCYCGRDGIDLVVLWVMYNLLKSLKENNHKMLIRSNNNGDISSSFI